MVKKPQAGVHGKSSKVYNVGIEINEEKCHKHCGELAHVSFDTRDLLLCNSHLILRFLKSTEDCITFATQTFLSKLFSLVRIRQIISFKAVKVNGIV